MSVQLGNKLLLNDISFSLPAGAHLAVFGAGGSGKTLLARVLKADVFFRGTVRFDQDGAAGNPRIAFVPATHSIKNLSNVSDFYYQQRYNSFDAEDALTLREELLKKGSLAEIDYWLQQFQLLHRADAPLIQLSNGELKKTQLISYLLTKPQVLILDKAFTGLDVASRKVLHTVLNELAANGTTIILITDTHELPSCITYFGELSGGRLINYGTVDVLGFLNYNPVGDFGGCIPEMKQALHVGPLIQMKGVSVRYGSKRILNEVHWRVFAGECWLVKGPNGAGKSTLLSLINADNPQGYAQPLFLFGKKRGTGESIWDIKKKIGYVSPELQHYFDKGISVFQTIASGFFETMGLYRPLTAEQEKAVWDWIGYLSLTDQAQLPLYSLSPSRQRLVFVARALVKSPLVLALDEPCQGLDDYQVKKMISLLDQIYEKTGVSIIFISHYDEDVPTCIKNVLELQNGTASVRSFQKKRKRILQAT